MSQQPTPAKTANNTSQAGTIVVMKTAAKAMVALAPCLVPVLAVVLVIAGIVGAVAVEPPRVCRRLHLLGRMGS